MAGTARTIKEMAQAAGVSARTLRYYESIGLLHPERTEAGYRLYREKDAKRLALVMAMRACGLSMRDIGRICKGEERQILPILKEHLAVLQKQSDSTKAAMKRTAAAIKTLEGMETMTADESFERMKEDGLLRFEERYGAEARKRYGNDVIDATNDRMMNLTRDEWDAKELLEEAIKVQLRLAMATKDPRSDASRELAHMHKRWITIHWGEGYSLDAYLGLVHGYLQDPRFVNYYDSAAGTGATAFLVEAVDAANAPES